jgi:hypothetical protein
MKNSLLIVFTFVSIVSASCGVDSEEKKLEESAKIDSIVRATELITKHKMESKIRLENQIESIETEIEKLEAQLIESIANLEVANDEMKRIKEWQLGRTTQERDDQIKNQVYKITKLEKDIMNLKDAIEIGRKKINRKRKELLKYE